MAGVGPDGLNRLPGDAEDHERDGQADERVAEPEAGRDRPRAGDDGERDEPVGTGMVAVGDQRGAVEAAAAAEADLRRELVADEADRARSGEDAEVLERL